MKNFKTDDIFLVAESNPPRPLLRTHERDV